MNVIAMKVGKSRLIGGLAVGETLLLDCTTYGIFNAIPPNISYTMISRGFDYFQNNTDLKLCDVENYDTIIFYTYEKYDEIRIRAIGINEMLNDKNVIFMVKEL